MSWREFCALPAVNAPKRAGLSPAERVVSMQLVQGSSNKEIARALGKSEFTVKNQVSAILRKCSCPSRARLVALLRPGSGTSAIAKAMVDEHLGSLRLR